ncbi:adipokinetic hormone/corazonin-related peptide receptor variant I-like isoform X4 [Ostrea edulis]|uniref:adipokinetic hormone/corazonin-related peptide receptor variant I-like isoform X4 n=1 Tax=Ostrea edulis TaxID=37623 RepID=UPI0020954950|nr:adipokinetic hormone/corazonin-related peptide receptor variant I-like isoform X4 [Ostrea edulis]
MSSETDSTIRFNRSVPFEDVYTTAPNDGILFMKFSCQNGFDDIQRNGSCKNQTDEVLPMDLVFTDENMVTIVAYTCMFIVAACGNLTVFITLFRNRNIKSRVNQFIFHLSIADLVVTFIMLPLEIIWNITVAWKAGDPACRILMFFRILGLYLSSFILVTISLDRYFAIVHPLSLNDADKRGRIMLILAWCFSIVASIPQSVIFHVETHPKHKTFTQCVTFNFFPSDNHELAYNLFNLITLYALPLLIITTSYSLILWEISKKTKQCKEETKCLSTRSRLRRSSVGNMERARIRTLKMTLVIVSVFVVCWTPYFVLSAWWWFDRNLGILTSARGFRAMTSMLTNTILGAGFYGVRQSVRSQSTEGPVSVCRVQFLHGSYCLRHVHYHLPPGNSKMGAVAIASVL